MIPYNQPDHMIRQTEISKRITLTLFPFIPDLISRPTTRTMVAKRRSKTPPCGKADETATVKSSTLWKPLPFLVVFFGWHRLATNVCALSPFIGTGFSFSSAPPTVSLFEPVDPSGDCTAGAAVSTRRRDVLIQTLWRSLSTASLFAIGDPSPARATAPESPLVSYPKTRAVGSGEEACRINNNCWETGEWDGAIGWSWGGRDRCDPADPQCGPDGKRFSSPLGGQPVPQPRAKITHVASLRLDIGRDGLESGILRLGLYGDDFPELVEEMVCLLTPSGLSTLARDANALGIKTQPVTLASGGSVTSIAPGVSVSFGVPSQANAFGRSRGLSRTDGFVPQPRPSPVQSSVSLKSWKHDAAGLVSVPRLGLGYNKISETDDAVFAEAFAITTATSPRLDAPNIVIGQILDDNSMAFLARLSNLPTQKGLLGVIPGQTSGPPLLKVSVKQVDASIAASG